MKTSLKTSKYSILMICLFLLMACNKDNDIQSTGINVQDLIADFNENPTNGAVVGTIQASSLGDLSFSISSQTPNGALSINPNNGELTVADASLFDFETNPVIEAKVSVIDPNNTIEASVTINLNDLDDIAWLLSTSKTAYETATDGDWVVITEAEYNTLANGLNNVTKVATNDSDYSQDPDEPIQVDAAIANNNGLTMPNGSLVFAVKYNFTSAVSGISIKIKQSSTSASQGYIDLGNPISSALAGDNYLVLKGSVIPTSATGYLAVYDSSKQLAYKNVTGLNIMWSAGDSSNLGLFQGNAFVFYQGLSTTQKQW